MIPMIPKNRLMDECEWRTLGIKQGPHWEHSNLFIKHVDHLLIKISH